MSPSVKGPLTVMQALQERPVSDDLLGVYCCAEIIPPFPPCSVATSCLGMDGHKTQPQSIYEWESQFNRHSTQNGHMFTILFTIYQRGPNHTIQGSIVVLALASHHQLGPVEGGACATQA